LLNYSQLLVENVPSSSLFYLQKAKEAAQISSFKVFVVGGFVRDLFLGVKHQDLDLVVEGNPFLYAGTLASLVGSEPSFNFRFGTVQINYRQKRIMDVAMTRKEYYPYPAALPVVKLATIKEDLLRRDFTLNALALRLDGKYFGKLYDYSGGLSDLKAKKIRILHPLSFKEDPTRIFRAVKFKVRFGMEIDEKTAEKAKEDIAKSYLSSLSAERIKNEILLILKEEKFKDILRELSVLGVLAKVFKGIDFSLVEKAWQRIELMQSRERLPFDFSSPSMQIALLFLASSFSETKELRRVFPSVWQKLWQDAFEAKTTLKQCDPKDFSFSESLRRLKPAAIGLALLLTDEKTFQNGLPLLNLPK